MVESKWSLDKYFGEGYTPNAAEGLFSAYELKNYPASLWEYIKTSGGRTNNDLFLFGLNQGFLPKHTNQALDSFGDKIHISSLDGGPIRGRYITDRTDRKVVFTIV